MVGLNWFVYIVECSDGSLYTGISNNVDSRIKAHNEGNGAKYTKPRLPVKLLWYQEAGNRSSASKLEYEIKKMKRIDKKKLIVGR